MATQGEVDAAALALANEDPVVIGMLTHKEILDLARAAVEAAERVRRSVAWRRLDAMMRASQLAQGHVIRTTKQP